MMYLWQADRWPDFTYQITRVQPLLNESKHLQQQLFELNDQVGKETSLAAEMDALIESAIRTSKIEGEYLDAGSVKSSVARQLGVEQAGLPPSNQQTDALVAMLTEATSQLNQPLTQQMLCDWQGALFPQASSGMDLVCGDLRGDGEMKVMSRKNNKEVVHFIAPPKRMLIPELKVFVHWFNKSQQDKELDPLLRAAIAHLWLITLHPFEDGNGRVTRALTDRALAQAEHTAVRFYSLSAAFEEHRQGYYQILEQTQSCVTASQKKGDVMDITEWLLWFFERLNHALIHGRLRVDRVIQKTKFWQYHSQTVLSERQITVLNHLLDDDLVFKEGIAAREYQDLVEVSKATATRDLAELVKKDCLMPLEGGGRSVRYGLKNRPCDITPKE